MNFEEAIAQLQPLFESYNFTIVEKSEDFILFESDLVSASLVNGWREKYGAFYIGVLNGRPKNMIHEDNMKEVFGHIVDDTNRALYFQNIVDFLHGKGRVLLSGDATKLAELEAYELRQARIYTDKLIMEQHKSLADKAWSEKDYAEFIKQIDLIAPSLLPDSYMLKYKIANEKVQNG